MTRLFAPADPALLAHTAVPLVPPADVRQWERDGIGMLEIALAGAGLVRAFRKGVATDSQARKLVEQLIVDGRAKLGAFTEAMAAGKASLESWVRNVFADVSARSTAAVMGFRMEPRLRPTDVPPLVARVARQGRFLAGFAKDIKDKVVKSAKQAVARVKLYADAVWGTGYGVLLDRAIADGYTEAQRQLGIADHCKQCLMLSLLGWLPIRQVTPIGQTVCQAKCHCRIEFR